MAFSAITDELAQVRAQLARASDQARARVSELESALADMVKWDSLHLPTPLEVVNRARNAIAATEGSPTDAE